MFRKVRDQVLEETNGRQEPFTYGSLPGRRISLAPPQADPAPAAAQGGQAAVELAYWNAVKESDDLAVIQSYIDKYPNGQFVFLAKTRLRLVKQRMAKVKAKPASRLAALDANRTVPPSSPESVMSPKALTAAVQRKLAALGCNPGPADGLWGARSRRALQEFARHGKVRLTSLSPSAESLSLLRKFEARVCPLACETGKVLKNGTCVASTCPDGQALSSDGTCAVTDPLSEAQQKPQSAMPKTSRVSKKCGRCQPLHWSTE